jgi:hypothetical protein
MAASVDDDPPPVVIEGLTGQTITREPGSVNG